MKRAIAFPILALVVIALTAAANYAVYQAGSAWFVQTPSLLVVGRNVLAVTLVLGIGWGLLPSGGRRRSSETLLLICGALFGLGLAMQFRLGHDAPRQLSNDEIVAVQDSVRAANPKADDSTVVRLARPIINNRNAIYRRDFDASRVDTRLARSLERAYGPTPTTRQVLDRRSHAPMDNPIFRLLPAIAAIVAVGLFSRSSIVAQLSARWRMIGFYGSLLLCALVLGYLVTAGGIRGANFAPQELLKLLVPVAWAGFLIHYRGAFQAETRERFTQSPLTLWLYVLVLLTMPLVVFIAMRDFGQFLVFGIAQVFLLAWFTRSALYIVLFFAALLASSVILLTGAVFDADNLLTVLAIVVGAVLLLAALERFRRRDALWTSATLVLAGYIGIALLAVRLPFVQSMLATPRQRFLLWADLYARDGNPNWWDQSRQIIEALYSFQAGGLFGRGLGQGSPFLIPKASSDFIFAAFGEELGLLGAGAIVLAYGSMAAIGLRIGRDLGKESFAGLLVASYILLLVAQAFIHITGTMNLLPMTGITLPLMSSGTSSLVVSWAMVGAVVGLAAREGMGAEKFVIRRDLSSRNAAKE